MNFEPVHLADVIEEEMAARRWDLDDVAGRMSGDCGINRLALEFFLSVRDKDVLLGEQAEQFAEAFGVGPMFFTAIHENWCQEMRRRD